MNIYTHHMATYGIWHRARLVLLALMISSVTLIALTPTAGHAAPRERCFRETGACVTDPILAYWENNGGVAIFGYPIRNLETETVEGSWTGPVQWFERDRLEDHSNEGHGVLAGRLGARWLEIKGTPWQTFPTVTVPSDPNCRFFATTNHSLCGRFQVYWEQHGGLARFGLPITEVFSEVLDGHSYEVQYFERRRMEYHPENAGTGYEVLLGLLGNSLGSPWFFSPAPQYAPDSAVRQYKGAIERFEHGFLIWIEAPDHFLMFLDNGQSSFVSAPYTFRTPDPIADTTPPPGRFKPIRGFGSIWSGEISNFDPPLLTPPHQLLGWAMEPERVYTTEFACHSHVPNYYDQRCYLRGPAGEIIWYGPSGWGYWK